MIATLSNHFKYQLALKQIDLDNDTIKCLLMRSGFVFNKDNHAALINITTTTGATTLSVDEPTSKFTRAAGSFITDGFVPGNSITGANFANAGNNATFIISTVSALEIVVTDNTGMVTETGDGDETIVSEDELATGNGYTQDTKTTGATTVTEDDTDDRCEMTFPTVTWTASGGDIGPTPGLLLYDDTSTDNTIIGYFDFEAEETATNGNTFSFANGSVFIA